MALLTLYYRQDCHLCEDFLAQLQELIADQPHTLILVDVDSNPDFHRDFGGKVPVLTGTYGELCHYELDRQSILRYLSSG